LSQRARMNTQDTEEQVRRLHPDWLGLFPTSAPVQSMLAIFAVPVLSLLVGVFTIRHDPAPPYLAGDYSPYGYTISLVIFLVPTVTLGTWFVTQCRRVDRMTWKAFWLTGAIVVPMWCLVDILLGNLFFRFPNPGATLGIFAPAFMPGRGWPRTIPIEEFVFYGSGCAVILLGYIWSAKSWLSGYTMPESAYLARVRSAERLIVIRPGILAAGALLFLATLAWKKLAPHAHQAGFPGYFLFELTLVIAPTAVLYGAVGPFLNRPAFVAKTLMLLLLSLMWEATMALPYGWWGYRDEQMIGFVIRPWFDLPIEAVILWPAAAYMNICLYEMIRLCLHRDRPLRVVLFGASPNR
jgi:hypothetical protein